jgi:hypothetical protein
MLVVTWFPVWPQIHLSLSLFYLTSIKNMLFQLMRWFTELCFSSTCLLPLVHSKWNWYSYILVTSILELRRFAWHLWTIFTSAYWYFSLDLAAIESQPTPSKKTQANSMKDACREVVSHSMLLWMQLLHYAQWDRLSPNIFQLQNHLFLSVNQLQIEQWLSTKLCCIRTSISLGLTK